MFQEPLARQEPALQPGLRDGAKRQLTGNPPPVRLRRSSQEAAPGSDGRGGRPGLMEPCANAEACALIFI